jgi:tetratricopeptide (TPR) repeat protein|tara:strand:- start:3485 stop:4900 length:1416 start_codon:yes stop_codon:yes gene_type:complete
MGFDIIEFWDRITQRWESKGGLFLTYLFVLIIFFSLANFFGFEKEISIWYKFVVVPLVLFLIVFIAWVYSTNRFFFRTGNAITAGIVVIVEDERDELLIKKIAEKVISHINQTEGFQKSIKLKLLPSNFCKHEAQVNKFHNNFYFMYDLIIRVFIESGNYESIEKILIEKFSVTFTRKQTSWKKRIFYDTIDLTKDMGLLVSSKNWEYLFSNSGVDKRKYFNNIHNIIIYYLAFYAIYVDKFDDAINILTPIFDYKKTVVNISKREGEKINIQLQPFQVAEGRLSAILIDLFFYSAIMSYHKSDLKQAISRLHELEKLIANHPKKFDQNINLARWHYELGNIEKAKEYNLQAKQLNPKAIQIYLNLGFFSILQNDIDSFCHNYKKIFELRNNPVLNWVDVLAFQITEFEKLNSSDELFNFSFYFIEYFFLGSKTREGFKEMVYSYKDNQAYQALFKLGSDMIKQPYLKKAN